MSVLEKSVQGDFLAFPTPLLGLNRTQPADPQPTTQGGWAGVVERGEAEVGGVAKNFELWAS